MVRDRLAEEHDIVLQPLDFYEYMYHLEQIGDLEYLRVVVTDRNGSYEVGYYRRPDLRREDYGESVGKFWAGAGKAKKITVVSPLMPPDQ